MRRLSARWRQVETHCTFGDLVGRDLVGPSVSLTTIERSTSRPCRPSYRYQVAGQLVLRELVGCRQRVLMQPEGILAERGRTEGKLAVRELDQRQPVARQQRGPGRIGPVGRGQAGDCCRLRLLGRARRKLLNGRVRKPEQAQHVAVGLDRGQQHFAALRRADLAHAVRRLGPARELAAIAHRPDVEDLAVVRDEEQLVAVAEARRVLCGRVGDQRPGLAAAETDQDQRSLRRLVMATDPSLAAMPVSASPAAAR